MEESRKHLPTKSVAFVEPASLEPRPELYRPYYRPDLCLIEWKTIGDDPTLIEPGATRLLSTMFRDGECRSIAFVLLPRLVQAIISKGERGRVEGALRRFEQAYAELQGSPSRLVVWAGEPTVLPIDSLDEFARQVATLHRAPVAAGLVQRPEEWPGSSYEVWLERKVYRLGWGWRRDSETNVKGRRS